MIVKAENINSAMDAAFRSKACFNHMKKKKIDFVYQIWIQGGPRSRAKPWATQPDSRYMIKNTITDSKNRKFDCEKSPDMEISIVS
jgi:hypothetical protein